MILSPTLQCSRSLRRFHSHGWRRLFPEIYRKFSVNNARNIQITLKGTRKAVPVIVNVVDRCPQTGTPPYPKQRKPQPLRLPRKTGPGEFTYEYPQYNNTSDKCTTVNTGSARRTIYLEALPLERLPIPAEKHSRGASSSLVSEG